MHSHSTNALDFDAIYFEIRQIFLSYYPNRLRTIFKSQNAAKWITLDEKTSLKDQLILNAVSNRPGSFRGLRWGDTTRFAVLDIDAKSPYHNIEHLGKLQGILSEVGLAESRLYRSSMSGGWHLYIPFSENISSTELFNLLKLFLKAKGFKIKFGELEVFPSRNGLRLPLQYGFAWLDKQTGSVLMTREELTTDEAICVFVNDIEDSTNKWEVTKLHITEELAKLDIDAENNEQFSHSDRISTEGFEQLYSNNIIQENYEKGRIYWQHGLNEGHEIHDAIISIGHYLWFGDEHISLPAYPGTWNDKTRKRLIQQWLENNHQGLSNTINSGDWEKVEENIRRAVEWRGHERNERPSYPITERVRERLTHLSRKTKRLWHIDDFRYANEEREKQAREKIKEAVLELSVEGKRISGRAIANITGCSRNTVRKHSDLWLQSGSCVYNSGLKAFLGSLENKDHSSLNPVVSENEIETASSNFEDSLDSDPSSETPVSSPDLVINPAVDLASLRERKLRVVDNCFSTEPGQKFIKSLSPFVLKMRKDRAPP